MAGMEPVSVAFGCAMGIAISITVLAIFMGFYKKKFFRNVINSWRRMEEGRPDMRQRKPTQSAQIVVPAVTTPPPAVVPKSAGNSPQQMSHGLSPSVHQTHMTKAVTFKPPSMASSAAPVESHPKTVNPTRSPPPVRSNTPTHAYTQPSSHASSNRMSAPVAVYTPSRVSEIRSSSTPPMREIPPAPHLQRKPVHSMLPPSPLAPRTYRESRQMPAPILIHPRKTPATPTSTRGPVTPMTARSSRRSQQHLSTPVHNHHGDMGYKRQNESLDEDILGELESRASHEGRPRSTEIAELPAFSIPEPPLTDHSATIFDIHGRYFTISPLASPCPTVQSRPRSVPAESMKEYNESPVLPPFNMPLTPSCASSTYPGASTRASSMCL